ncbi:MAG TPA: tetratricopeptide repeat protein [Gemmatimonadales bacterium]|nr:tetratricopeptide repeat protein [Gemmatimonadales bacterium]
MLDQRAGRPADALSRYREVVEQDIGFYMAHVRMAEIHEGAARWDRAVEARRHALNANPDDPSLMLDLGVTLAKAGRLADAEEALRQALEANPRDARVPYYLGVVQQQLGEAADAAASFRRFLTLAPSRYDRQIADARRRLASLE